MRIVIALVATMACGKSNDNTAPSTASDAPPPSTASCGVNVAVNHYVTDIDPLTWATAFEAALTADTRPAL